MLIRLRLRAGEVATLKVDDLVWRVEEIMVRDKGGHEDRLPMSVDVGEALVGYLRRGRPHGQSRALFLRAHAPVRGLTSGGISQVVRDACGRADLPAVGAHRLRQTAATEMLRAGAPLSEIPSGCVTAAWPPRLPTPTLRNCRNASFPAVGGITAPRCVPCYRGCVEWI